jgi:hypothetical protein
MTGVLDLYAGEHGEPTLFRGIATTSERNSPQRHRR